MTNFIKVWNCGSWEDVLQPLDNANPQVPMIVSKGERISHGEIDCSKRQSPAGEFDQVLSMLAIFAETPSLAFLPVKSVMICLVGADHCKFWKNPGKERLRQANLIAGTN